MVALVERIDDNLPVHGLRDQGAGRRTTRTQIRTKRVRRRARKPWIDVEIRRTVRGRDHPHQTVLLTQRQFDERSAFAAHVRKAALVGNAHHVGPRDRRSRHDRGTRTAAALPQPWATLAPRWRHTFRNARSLPSRPRTIRTGKPAWSSVLKAARRGPVRKQSSSDQRMLAKQNPLLLGEAPCVRIDRHLVAPGAIRHRGGPGLHVMQQPLQKVDLDPARSLDISPGYGFNTDHSSDTAPYQYHLPFRSFNTVLYRPGK